MRLVPWVIEILRANTEHHVGFDSAFLVGDATDGRQKGMIWCPHVDPTTFRQVVGWERLEISKEYILSQLGKMVDVLIIYSRCGELLASWAEERARCS